MTFDRVITGGVLVTPDGVLPGTLGILDGRIAAIVPPGTHLDATATWNGAGLHVLPGAIDIHCHIRARSNGSAGTSREPSARYQRMAWLSERYPLPGTSSSGMRPFGFFARNSAVRVSPRLMSSSTSS